MVQVEIPGQASLHLEHLVLDYNGTLARDGKPLVGVKGLLIALSKDLRIHVVTGGTFGDPSPELAGIDLVLDRDLPATGQHEYKLDYAKRLGFERTVCIGNGRNDRLMLKEAALGIVVIQDEGASVETVSVADVVCRDIPSALDLLLNPRRLTATLRS